MQRGILILSRDELIELVKYVSLEKFDIAMQEVTDENRIFVNEDELEGILDEIGIIQDSEVLVSAREKISKLLLSFRSL